MYNFAKYYKIILCYIEKDMFCQNESINSFYIIVINEMRIFMNDHKFKFSILVYISIIICFVIIISFVLIAPSISDCFSDYFSFVVFLLLFVCMYGVLFYLTISEHTFQTKIEEQQHKELLEIYLKNMDKEIVSVEKELNRAYQLLLDHLKEGSSEEMMNIIESIKIESFISHPFLNALLIYKKHQIEQNRNVFIIEGDISENIAMDDKDLISLISNLLDNAINAAKSIPHSVIYFKIRQLKNILQIKVSNDSLNKTTEEDWHHGFGKKIIKDIIDKYNGEIRVEEKHSKYDVNCFLILK